ncbi:MAG TPA: hypothetical protein PKD53_09800 [Chloroflexaceae bacterium]|nr:hypothetical protein [Chloroflexaceae bacterium]
MVKRLFLTVTLAFVLGTIGLALVPHLARIAGPLLCAGTLEPETRQNGLRYRCVEAADGRVSPVATDSVVLATVPMLAAILLLPVHGALVAAERRARAAQGAMRDDLAVAVRARAEILRVGRRNSLSRQALVRAAELSLVLWVQPPEGRPYEARVAWLVDDESVGRLSVGTVLAVKVNPRRPEHVYPDQPWAHYAWWS